MLEHWLQGLQISFPNSMVYFFSALAPIQGHKVQHLLVTWGQVEKIFSIFSLDSWCKKALGADFNFCTNRNARFELNIGLDSSCKVGLNKVNPRCITW
jgi:hypothetical protein